MKLTEWYPPDVKPVHVGVYEVEWRSDISGRLWSFYNYFDGSKFSWGQAIAAYAEPTRTFPDQAGVIRWRGVSK